MIKLINEETGKSVLTIQDNGDLVAENVKITSDQAVTEAFEKAKVKEEK